MKDGTKIYIKRCASWLSLFEINFYLTLGLVQIIVLMPKIFEYLGILLYFYSNEHEPIHVHGKKAEFESKAEFYIENGEIIEIRIRKVKGYKALKGRDLNYFEEFLEVYASKIVEKWVDYFVYHKDVKFEKINKRIK